MPLPDGHGSVRAVAGAGDAFSSAGCAGNRNNPTTPDTPIAAAAITNADP